MLLDSGQFGDFTAKPRRKTDYARVMRIYLDIVSNCPAPENISLVAPDLIGDSEGTWGLLNLWLDDLLGLKNQGARLVVPVQKGALGISSFIQQAQALLGFDIICGIPCKESPLTESETLAMLSQTQPGGVHFLGLCVNKRGLMSKAQYLLGGSAVLTSDSTRLRSAAGDGKPFTQAHRELTERNVGEGLYGSGEFKHLDLTETMGYLPDYVSEMSDCCLNRLIKSLGVAKPTSGMRKLFRSADEDQFWSLADEFGHGYGYELLSRWHQRESRSEVSPKMRSEAICLAYHARIL